MIATLSETTTLADALTANLIATEARAAGWDGDRCAVCGKIVQAGQRIADLADGRGLVHVLRCAGMADASRRTRAATAAAREPQPEPRHSAAQAASHGRTEPSAQPSQRRRARAGAQAG